MASSTGKDKQTKRITQEKLGEVMHEFKEHTLTSGKSTKKVTNPKQAIAIGLSEARRAGAKIPPSPNAPRTASKNASAKKTAKRKSAAKRPAARA